MTRVLIDYLAGRMEAAYRGDRFHAVRKNLEDVRPEEWDVRPAQVERGGLRQRSGTVDLPDRHSRRRRQVHVRRPRLRQRLAGVG